MIKALIAQRYQWNTAFSNELIRNCLTRRQQSCWWTNWGDQGCPYHSIILRLLIKGIPPNQKFWFNLSKIFQFRFCCYNHCLWRDLFCRVKDSNTENNSGLPLEGTLKHSVVLTLFRWCKEIETNAIKTNFLLAELNKTSSYFSWKFLGKIFSLERKKKIFL